MSVSPADFALYSRVTGRPMPRTPQEQMAMTPEVFKFTREFGRGAPVEQEPGILRQVAGDLGKLALLGAAGGAVYGLGQTLNTGKNIPPVSEVVTSDVGESPQEAEPYVRHPTPLREKMSDISNQRGIYDAVAAHDFGSPQDGGFVEPYVRTTQLPEGNYGTPLANPSDDPNFYSEIVSHDFGSTQSDGFVEPYVRTTQLPEGNYGNQIGTVGSLQGGQDEILGKLQRQQEMSEAGDKALDQVENMMGMGNIPPDVRESLKEEAFGAVDNNDFVNEFISQLVTDGEINDSMPTSELSEVYSNLSDAASDPDFKEGYNRIAENLNSIQETPVKNPRSNRFESIRQQEEDRADLDYTMSGGAALDQGFEDAIGRDDAHEERFGLPGSERAEIVVVEDPQTAIDTSQTDPRSFLGNFARGAIAKADQEVKDFDHGIPWGERTDQALSSDSSLGGAAILAGTLAEKGAKDLGTRFRKDATTAGNIVSEAVANVKKIPGAIQEVDSVIAHEQNKASIIPDNKMQETVYLNPPVEGSGGVEIGIESDLSDTPQFDDTHQENEQVTLAGFNRQTGLNTSSTTNLNPDKVREVAQNIRLNIPYADKVKLAVANLSGAIAESPIAQAGDQAAKKVVRGVLKTVVGKEKFNEMAAQNLREQQADRIATIGGNEARMANIRSKYSMDYNPAAPKLAGDSIPGIGTIPTGGIDILRDESVPASAYDVRVPREDEETPLWWEV